MADILWAVVWFVSGSLFTVTRPDLAKMVHDKIKRFFSGLSAPSPPPPPPPGVTRHEFESRSVPPAPTPPPTYMPPPPPSTGPTDGSSGWRS